MVSFTHKKTTAIELFGGAASLARAIGISYAAVGRWQDSLPSRISDRVIAALVRMGKPVPPELLAPPVPMRRCQKVGVRLSVWP